MRLYLLCEAVLVVLAFFAMAVAQSLVVCLCVVWRWRGWLRRNNNHLTPDEADSFVEGVTEIVEGVSLTSFNLASVEISSVLERMMGLVRRYRVNLDPAFTSLVVSIIVLEGVGYVYVCVRTLLRCLQTVSDSFVSYLSLWSVAAFFIRRQLDSDSDIFSLALPILWRSDPSVRNQIASVSDGCFDFFVVRRQSGGECAHLALNSSSVCHVGNGSCVGRAPEKQRKGRG